jgi:hypothetical protein
MAAVSARTRCRTRTATPGRGAAAVAFEVEVACEGLVDRLDDLAQRFEQVGSGAFRLALAGRAEQVQTGLVEGVIEVAARRCQSTTGRTPTSERALHGRGAGAT